MYKTHSSEIFTIAKLKVSGEQQVFNKMFVCTTKEEKFCVFFAFFTLMIPLSSCWNSSDAQAIRKNGVLSGNYDRLVRPSQITNVSVAFNLLTINDLVRYRIKIWPHFFSINDLVRYDWNVILQILNIQQVGVILYKIYKLKKEFEMYSMTKIWSYFFLEWNSFWINVNNMDVRIFFFFIGRLIYG